MLTLHILNNMVKWAFLFIIMNLVGKSNFISHVVVPLTVKIIHILSQILDLGFKAIILTLRGQISGVNLKGRKYQDSLLNLLTGQPSIWPQP